MDNVTEAAQPLSDDCFKHIFHFCILQDFYAALTISLVSKTAEAQIESLCTTFVDTWGDPDQKGKPWRNPKNSGKINFFLKFLPSTPIIERRSPCESCNWYAASPRIHGCEAAMAKILTHLPNSVIFVKISPCLDDHGCGSRNPCSDVLVLETQNRKWDLKPVILALPYDGSKQYSLASKYSDCRWRTTTSCFYLPETPLTHEEPLNLLKKAEEEYDCFGLTDFIEKETENPFFSSFKIPKNFEFQNISAISAKLLVRKKENISKYIVVPFEDKEKFIKFKLIFTKRIGDDQVFETPIFEVQNKVFCIVLEKYLYLIYSKNIYSLIRQFFNHIDLFRNLTPQEEENKKKYD